jgi:hypothetical protein
MSFGFKGVAEISVAVAAIGSCVFAGIQSHVLLSTLNVPFQANVQQRQVDICERALVAYDLLSFELLAIRSVADGIERGWFEREDYEEHQYSQKFAKYSWDRFSEQAFSEYLDRLTYDFSEALSLLAVYSHDDIAVVASVAGQNGRAIYSHFSELDFSSNHNGRIAERLRSRADIIERNHQTIERVCRELILGDRQDLSTLSERDQDIRDLAERLRSII